MKQNFLLLIGLFTIALLSLNSCSKEIEPTSLAIDMSKTTKITGYVYAQLDLLNDTTDLTWENAPSGTKVIIKIENDEYPGISGAGTKTYETTVGSDGRYSYDVPTSNDGVNITVMLVDFEYNQKQRKLDDNFHWVANGTERKIYTVNNWTPSLTAGSVEIHDFYYAAN